MASDAFPPDLLATYTMGEKLASGGFGAVWRARHRELDREAAVKLLHAEAQADPAQVRRFEAEARIAAQIEHPHVVRVLDFGLGDGHTPWIAYAFAAGDSVAKLLESGPLEPRRACAIATQIARALAAAHARGVVHRDVKPDNVLEVAPGHFALSDFGIALWNERSRVKTATGVILGTPAYVAPEVIEGQPASAASDVYALGVMLHEMLAGAPPFTGGIGEVLRAHLETPPPDVPGGGPLAAVVRRALAKRPAERFASAEAFAQVLEVGPDERPATRAIRTRPSGKTAVVTRGDRDAPVEPRRRPRVAVALAGVLACAAIGAAALRPRPAPSPTATPSVASVAATPAPRPRPSFVPHVLLTQFYEGGATYHDLGMHSEESVLYLEGMTFLADTLRDAKGAERTGWLEQAIRLRDAALTCDADRAVRAGAVAKIRAFPGADALEREAFRLTLARPELAAPLDRAQLKIDDAESAAAPPATWIRALERDEPPALLTPDRSGFKLTETDEIVSTAYKADVLHNLRNLSDAGWANPAARGALEQFVEIVVKQLYETPGLRDRAGQVKLEPREERRLVCHAIVVTRLLLERIVGRGYPWHAQFKFVRMARHLGVLAQRLGLDRRKALAAALDEALERKTCFWMKQWRLARDKHDAGDHGEECRGYALAMISFENGGGLDKKPLDKIPQSTLQAWLRIRADLSPIGPVKRLHEDAALRAATELIVSWIPEEQLEAKLVEIRRRVQREDP